jgi:hypothetical protein
MDHSTSAHTGRPIIAADNRCVPARQAERDYAVGSELAEACYFAGTATRTGALWSATMSGVRGVQ